MYRNDDRRAKLDGTHLEHAIRVRFTEAENVQLERMAAMYTGGRLAPWIRRCALLGQRLLQVRNERMLAALISGEPMTEEQREEFAHFLASLIEQEVSSVDQAI